MFTRNRQIGSTIYVKGLNHHLFTSLTVQQAWLSASLSSPSFPHHFYFFLWHRETCKSHLYCRDSLATWQTSLLPVCSVNRPPPICHSGTWNIVITADQKPSSSLLDIFRGETMLREPQRTIHQPRQPEDSSAQRNTVEETPAPHRPAETRFWFKCPSAERATRVCLWP